MIRVLKAGFLTVVQDAGRHGYQRFGFAVGGAADVFALRVANALVGNDGKAAGLEMALTGPRLRFDSDALVAWCGAEFDAMLNDQPLPKHRPVLVPAGGYLDFPSARRGAMAWLSIAGGIDVPEIMGSRSTDPVARIGGVEGRKLGAGDSLPVGVASAWGQAMLKALRKMAKPVGWSLPPERLGVAGEPGVLRAMRGPEWDWFTPEAREAFFHEGYRVTRESNRMGIRLAGPSLELTPRREMFSAAVNQGVVQVPPSGLPILLGADRQTIGGYPRIGVVAAVDFNALSQLRPDDTIHFREVSILEAHDLLLKRESDLAIAIEDLKLRAGL